MRLDENEINAIAKEIAETIKPLLKDSKVPDEDKVLDVKALAEYLKVPQSWVRKKVASGKFPHFKSGKYLRFKKSKIDKWIETQSFQPLS